MPKRARDNSELRFADIASVNPRTPLNGFDPDAPVSFIPMADVDDGGRWVTRQTRPLREVKTGYSPFADGDTLFAKITPCTENGKGCHARGLANGVGFGSTEFHVLRAKKGTDPRLVFHLAQSSDVRWKAAAVMDGSAGQQRVPADFFKICRIAPDILDNQDAKCDLFDAVDAAIDATRGVIEQTRRLKTAVLQDLLTRGLPGRHSEFREVKGLGQVPRAWKPTRLKRLTTRITDGVHASVKTVDDGVPFLYVSCVRDGRVLWDHAARITQKTYAEISRGREPVAGGVLYTAVGSYGHAAVLDDDRAFSFQRHIAYLVPDPSKLDPHFLALWLNSERGRRQADRVALGNAQKTITLGELNAWEIPLPKLDEQQDLVAVARSIDGRIAADNAHLLRLGRAKTALSQALLTGRVRVPAKGVPVAS
jgi:type I restriction enzyme S subunit